MKTISKASLLTAFLCFFLIISACSSKQNSAGRQQAPVESAASGNQSMPPQPDSSYPVNSGPPAKALVFTYNADCCESTRQFFEQHRNSVKDFENKYGNHVQFTWYDVAVKSEEYQNEVMAAAKRVGIKNIPAFVVMDVNGTVLTRQIGQINMDETNKIFEGLNR